MRKIFKIALVDDNPSVNENNIILLNQISALEIFSMINFDIDHYEDGQDLLDSETEYDLIIMDYEMPNINGIIAATELSKRDIKTKILFLSGYDELTRPMQKSVSLRNVIDFVFKNDSKEQLEFAIKQAIKLIIDVVLIEISCFIEKDDIDNYRVIRESSDLIIDANKIIWIASRKKINIICTTDGRFLNTIVSLSEILKILPAGQFSQISKDSIVNFKYALSSGKRELTLTNGEEFKIGSMFKIKFENEWRSYKLRKAMETC